MRALFVFLFLFWFQISTVHGESGVDGVRKLRVGVIAPLTGGIAAWGQSVRSALELANSESQNPAELFFEDEGTCSPSRAVTAFRALQAEKKIDILVASCLGGAQAVAPLAQRSGIPLLISGRSSHEFQRKNSNALSWLTLLDYEGQAIANLVRDRGWKRGTAMIWSEYFGVQFAKGIESGLRHSQVDFKYGIIEVMPEANISGTEIQRLLGGNPDVVFLMMSEPAAAFVVKQLKALKYRGSIILQSSMLQTYDRNARRVFEGALQQKFSLNPVEFSRLQSLIKIKQGTEVADDFVFSYDGFRALLDEAASCRRDQSALLEACLIERMRNENWREGASGRFRFMKDGSTERPMLFKTITADGFDS